MAETAWTVAVALIIALNMFSCFYLISTLHRKNKAIKFLLFMLGYVFLLSNLAIGWNVAEVQDTQVKDIFTILLSINFGVFFFLFLWIVVLKIIMGWFKMRRGEDPGW